MNHIFDFFFEPYRDAIWSNIILEIVAVVSGVASVLYAKKEKILVFPTGIISTLIYVYICFHFVLYADMIINIYYTIMSIYGWYMWSKVTDKGQLQISKTNMHEKLKALMIFTFTAALGFVVYGYYGIIDVSLTFFETKTLILSNLGTISEIKTVTPYIDIITTGIFFTGMWLMANKKIENWTLWIVGDIISIPLYFVKGLGFSAIQFLIFLVIAIYGYNSWKKSLDKNLQA